MIAHIVFFNPKAGVTSADRRSFALSIQETCRTVTAISKAFIGRSVDVDPGYARSLGDKTYQFAAVLEFEDSDGLIAYLNHPAHEQLGRLFWQYCESTVIVEVECADARGDGVVDLIMRGEI